MLVTQQHGVCPLCHKLMLRSHALEVDHIVPVSKGGALADPGNMQAVHMECNRAKGAGMPES